MMNKKRLIVLLLSLSMIMSQMSVFSFADDEAAPAQEQPAVEQTVQEEAPAVAEEPATVEAEPAKVEEAAPAEETAAPAPAQTEEATAVEETQPEEVVFDQTVTEDGVDITVKAAKGVFPKGAVLTAKSVKKPDVIDAENALAFDIKILFDGEEVQPKDNAKVEVSFKTADVKKYDTEVYHMDGNKPEQLDVKENGTTATVETTGFSTYVLVFESVDLDSSIARTMEGKEEIEVETLIGTTARPTEHKSEDGYAFSSWNFNETVSHDSRITVGQNGAGKKYVKITAGATFSDGSQPYITVPYTYSTTAVGYTQKDEVKVIITVRDADAEGVIVAPTPKSGLVAGSSAQELINAGSTEVGTMMYKGGSATAYTSNASDVKGTTAGNYVVNWKVVDTNNVTIKDGTLNVTIADAALPTTTATVTYTAKNSSKEAPQYAYDRSAHGINSVALASGSAGEAKNVKVYYSYDHLDATNYTQGVEDVSSLNPTDAGTTRIYYYVTSSNYAPVGGFAEITINKAVAYITVKNQHLTYGDDPIPYDTVTLPTAAAKNYIEIKAVKEEGDTTTLPFSTNDIKNLSAAKFIYGKYTCENNSPVGAYNVILDSNLEADNFVVKPVSGKLTIHPKQVSFVWSTKFSWNYDGNPHIITAQVNPDDLVPSDKEKVTVNYVMDDEDNYTWKEETNVKRDNNWAVKPYQYKVASLNGSNGNYIFFGTANEANAYNNKVKVEGEYAPNYTATTTTIGNMWILPLTLTLTPDDLTIPYGDDPKTYEQTFKSSGLLDGEGIGDVLIGKPEYKYYKQGTTTEYTPGDSVTDNNNKYEIKIVNVTNATDSTDPVATGEYKTHNTKEGLYAQNYQVETAAGTLTVVPRVIEKFDWKVKTETLEYDGKFKTAYVDSVENDFGPGTQYSALYQAVYDKEKQINAGTYTSTITLSETAAKNYVIKDGDTTTSYTWTITQRPATIYINSNSITYGQDPAYKGYSIVDKPVYNEEKKAVDTVADVTLTSRYKKNGKPGQYAIEAVLSNEDPNYDITVVNGVLAVSDRVTTLNAKGTKSGKKGILVSWNSVTGAASYDVYMSLCNTKKKVYTPVYVGSTSGNSFKVKKIGKKKLKAKTPYKYYVVAKDASGAVIAQSTVGHFITNNVKGKKVNAKRMAVNTRSVTIAKGGTAGLSASYTKAKKGKKYKLLTAPHANLTRYVSENTAVATVDANGVVHGVGTGWTRVHVIGVSGMWETVEVYVN